MWVNLEPIIQSEVRKRKINVYMWNLEKTVLMNLSAEQQWRHRQKTDLWTQHGKERVGQAERSAETHTLPCVKQTASAKLLSSTGSSAQCPVMT